MKCTFCQSEIEDVKDFCPFCGNKLEKPSKKAKKVLKEPPKITSVLPAQSNIPKNHPIQSNYQYPNTGATSNIAKTPKKPRAGCWNWCICVCIVWGLVFAMNFVDPLPNSNQNSPNTTTTPFGSIIRYENLVIDQQKDISFYLYAGQAVFTIEYNPEPQEINGTIYSGNVTVANYHYGDESNFTWSYCYSTRDGADYHATTHTWELKSDFIQIINLTIKLYSTEDIYEENDEMVHAFEYNGGLPGLKYNDQDWYKINITQETGSRIGVYSTRQFYLKIYNENGAVIAQTASGTVSSAEVPKGCYYIQVCSSDGFTGQDYSLM